MLEIHSSMIYSSVNTHTFVQCICMYVNCFSISFTILGQENMQNMSPNCTAYSFFFKSFTFVLICDQYNFMMMCDIFQKLEA